MNKRQLKKSARDLFRQLDNAGLITLVNYKQLAGEPVYDVVRGEESEQYTVIENLECYISSYSKLELSSSVLISDSRAIVLLKDINIAPSIDDKVEYDGVEYSVISFVNNPNKTSIEFQLRSA